MFITNCSRHIKLAAHETNGNLYRVIQSLPLQVQPPQPVPAPAATTAPTVIAASPSTTVPSSAVPIRKDFALADQQDPKASSPVSDPLDSAAVTTTKAITPSLSSQNVPALKIKTSSQAVSEPVTPVQAEFPKTKRSDSPQPTTAPPLSPHEETIDDDPFDVRETVNVLTLQFLSDHAETRIAALEWLLMLHLKAPTKVGTWRRMTLM